MDGLGHSSAVFLIYSITTTYYFKKSGLLEVYVLKKEKKWLR